jgi:hypothetical protein
MTVHKTNPPVASEEIIFVHQPRTNWSAKIKALFDAVMKEVLQPALDSFDPDGTWVDPFDPDDSNQGRANITRQNSALVFLDHAKEELQYLPLLFAHIDRLDGSDRDVFCEALFHALAGLFYAAGYGITPGYAFKEFQVEQAAVARKKRSSRSQRDAIIQAAADEFNMPAKKLLPNVNERLTQAGYPEISLSLLYSILKKRKKDSRS